VTAAEMPERLTDLDRGFDWQVPNPGAYDPDNPLALLETAVRAEESTRATAVVWAVRSMVAAGAPAFVLTVTGRDYVGREKLLALGVYDNLVRDSLREHARETGHDGGDRGPSIATQLVELAQELFTFGISDQNEPFAIPVSGPKVVAMLKGSKMSLRALLSREYFSRTGRAATQQALADALLIVHGIAQEQEPSEIYIRCAQHDDALWLDLGDHTGRAVKVTAGGWRVEDEPPVLFKRTVLTGALPEPEHGGSLDDLWAWLNISKEERPLIAAELVARLFSEDAHVVLAVFGEQGTGKTTAVKVLVLLLDPGPVPVRKPPRDAESWVTAASASWVVALDNLSDIPPWLSDAICRASTKEGDVRRQLHTDKELAVFAFRRCVIFDAIDVGAIAPDLAERALVVTLSRIADKNRKTEKVFWAEWEKAHPKLLGAILDLAGAVLKRLPAIDLPEKPRMADFAEILAAVDAELGTQGLRRYRLQSAALAADGLSGDSLAVRMQEAVTEPFEGSSAALLKLVTPGDDDWHAPKDWPKDARDVTGRMSRLAPAFRKVGWTVANLGSDNHDNVVHWAVSPPSADERPRDDPRAPSPDSQSGEGARVREGESGIPRPPGKRDMPACPRHQTRWGPRTGCPDCQALAAIGAIGSAKEGQPI
jgi:hypothetical protein